MENFIKLIQNAYKENFSTLTKKFIAEKIPIAFLSYSATKEDFEFIKHYKNNGINVSYVITIPPPKF